MHTLTHITNSIENSLATKQAYFYPKCDSFHTFLYIYTCQKFTKKLVTLVTSGDMRCQPINDTKHKNNTCNIIKYLLLHLV